MRELEVSTGTKILRIVGAAVVLALVLLAAIVYSSQRRGDASVSDGAGSSKGAASASYSGRDKAQVRQTQVNPHESQHAAVAGLDPRLREAIQEAARTARDEGVRDFWLTSGFRTHEYQQELLDRAVQKQGSLDAALAWVRTPQDSEHVLGKAVDVGPTAAAAWMDRNAERFGLCRTYANELWHYELRAGSACPAQKADARG